MDAETVLYGLIGRPVSHSLSPAMHNALFRLYGMNAVYLAFEVSDLEGAIKGIRALGIRGLNVTMPHKETVVGHLDGLSSEAEALNSVNTVVNRGGELIGHNTDGVGTRKALERFTKLKGRRVLIIGAGGAGKAIAHELSKVASVVVLNRTPERAKTLERFGIEVGRLERSRLEAEIRNADVLINATPVGMNEERSIVPPELLPEGAVVMDAVYTPPKTLLLREAEARGCLTVDGLWMLVYQGAESFRLWTGVSPDVDFMRRVALEGLSKRGCYGG
ncbi:shikimate dehydrogenase [Thermococcus sp. GR7]|uniref:shikimate dehydrogenase n=1 Tax=unclassified Thermococcus TaxID=2627626 RepID=UPI0014316EC6|nr:MULTISPECIES: shikimate dehydrogenase [unclassified Thermococcus]NJE47463.1 shikimate dehydrogenase [Thermococcus sp. GR7]NJE78609.1 shikimate dehydrogenase [Thermococcus sp. GR4]NJF23513.1 shikimate dehydrogenase [Thermococcus sp. GR5]